MKVKQATALALGSGLVDPTTVRVYKITRALFKLSPTLASTASAGAIYLVSKLSWFENFRSSVLQGTSAVFLEEALSYVEDEDTKT